jgi:endonuclease G
MLWTLGMRCRRQLGRALATTILLGGLTACAVHPGSDGDARLLDTSGLTSGELTALHIACPATPDKASQRDCYTRHLQDLALAPPPPELARLSLDESLRLNSACSVAQAQGPAEFRRCQARELEALLAPPVETADARLPDQQPPSPPVPEAEPQLEPEQLAAPRPGRTSAAVRALPALPASALDGSTACPQHFLDSEAPALINPRLSVQAREVCHTAFAVLHSGVTRTPLWVAEHLTRSDVEAAEGFGRRASFHAERTLPQGERAELADYERSGYDRGHLAPAEDMPSPQTQRESFSLANIVPQDPRLNRGLWASIEKTVRKLARDSGEVYVITGPIFQGETLDALNGRVMIPTQVFKAVYDPVTRRAGAYVAANDNRGSWETVSLSRLRELTGIDVFPSLPEAISQKPSSLPPPGGDGIEEAGRRAPAVEAERPKRAGAKPAALPRARAPSSTAPAAVPALPRSQPRACCRYCSKGQPCGNSCISWRYTCRQPPGCAC